MLNSSCNQTVSIHAFSLAGGHRKGSIWPGSAGPKVLGEGWVYCDRLLAVWGQLCVPALCRPVNVVWS